AGQGRGRGQVHRQVLAAAFDAGLRIGPAQGRIHLVRFRLRLPPTLEQRRRAQRILQLFGEGLVPVGGERQRRLAAACGGRVGQADHVGGHGRLLVQGPSIYQRRCEAAVGPFSRSRARSRRSPPPPRPCPRSPCR